MEAVIFIGIQGSGKSSFFKERFFSTHVRISLDMLKTRHREQQLLGACLATEQRFVIDNTNPMDEQAATMKAFGLSVGQKNQLLFDQGINFNEIANWQKRGIGLYWEEFDKPSQNPVTGEQVVTRRRRIKRDCDLPMKDEYSAFIERLITPS